MPGPWAPQAEPALPLRREQGRLLTPAPRPPPQGACPPHQAQKTPTHGQRPEQFYFRANFGYQPLKKGAATEKASPSALPMSPHLGPENVLDALCDEASPGMAPRDWLLAPATLASSSSGLSGPLPHSVQDKQAGGGPSYGAERPGGQPARGNHLGRGSGTHSHLTGCVFQVRERTLHRGCLLALPQAASPSDRQTDKQATFQTPGRGNHRAEL